MDKRKLFGLIGLIVGSIGIAIAIYFVFFKSDTPEPTPITDETGTITGFITADGERVPVGPDGEPIITPDAFPESEARPPSAVADGGPTATQILVPSDARDLKFNPNAKSLQYYDPITGLFHRIGADGEITTLNDTPLVNARDVAWANGTDKAIVEFPDGANVFYDFKTQEQRTLPSHWTEFEFSPQDESIAAKKLGFSPENRHLIIANPDGTAERAVTFLGKNAHKLDVSWSPNDQVIGFAHTGRKLGLGREEVLLVGKHNENFPSLIVEGLKFQPKWSTKGDALLYSSISSNNDLQPELWLVNADTDSVGEQRIPLGLTTWADKCTFSNNENIYCAVPNPDRLPFGIGFRPDMANNTDDTIYQINLNTGTTSIVGKPDKSVTVDSLVVSDDNSLLYFTEKNTGTLHQMILK